MSLQLKKLISEIASSSASRMLGGALCGGLIVGLIMQIGRNFDFGFQSIFIWIVLLILAFIVFMIAYYFWRIWQVDKIIDNESKNNDTENMQNNSILNDSQTRKDVWERQKIKKQEIKKMVSLAKKTMKEYFSQEIAKFKKTKRQKYDLPHILHVGESDSGKTTLLSKSNLFFSIEGNTHIGGTPFCDFWGPDEAVILDTPGRYAISANPEIDNEELKFFLKQLVKYRPRRPIDGVIVVISADSLMNDSLEEMKIKAKNIRDTLHDIVSILGVVFPVYIMITMMDRILGFSEFVSSLDDNEEHTQIFGWNRPRINHVTFNYDEFSNLFDTQVQRLDMWSLRRIKTLSSENESNYIYRICAFSSAFRQLKPFLRTYLEIIFRHDTHKNHKRKDHPLIFRGCYFSSSMQEGNSIFRKFVENTKESENNFMEKIDKSFTETSRSYFVDKFYKKIFMEKGLVKQTKHAVKKEFKYTIAAAVTAIVLILAVIFILKPGYQELKDIVNPINKAVSDVQGLLLNNEKMPISKVVSYIDSIEEGRKNLSVNKGQQIIQDLKIIEDALIIKGVFRPIIKETNKSIDKISLIDMQQKSMLIQVLQQYFYIISDKSLYQISIKPILNFFLMTGRFQENVCNKIDKLMRTYPRGNYIVPVLAEDYPVEEIIQIRKALLSLRSFWETHTNDQWQKKWLNLKHAANAYSKLFEKIDKIQVKNFENYSNLLINHENNIFLDPPSEFQSICNADYDDLLIHFPTNENTISIKKVIERHKSICSKIKQEIVVGWDSSQKSWMHLLNAEGAINPKLSNVIKALSVTVDFGSLFLNKHKQQLKGSIEMSGLISEWNTDWNKEKDIVKTKIAEELASVSAKGWRKNELLLHLNRYLDNVVCHEMRTALNYAINIVLSNFSNLWRKKIGHLFPFRNAGVTSVSNYIDQVSTINISTASLSNLYDFFFAPEYGFESLSKNLESLRSLSYAPVLSKEQNQFIARCNDWKKFLYDKSGKPNEHQIKIFLKPHNYAGSIFTQMQIQGLTEVNVYKILRFSGIYKEATLNWNLALNPNFRFKLINEETKRSSTLNINGNNLLLPGYLYKYGQKSVGGISWDLVVSFPYVSREYKKMVDVKLRFDWDETIPPIINYY